MADQLAYGFVGLEHLMQERIQKVGIQAVMDAVQSSAQEYSRQINDLMASFVERTTEPKRRFYLPGDGTLQPLDEYGNPRTVRPSGSYDVAFPIQGGGTAWGSNRVSRALMTVEEANRATLDALRRDADWLRRHILAAVLDNQPWTFTDPEYGDLTIVPLANGDSVSYVRVGGDKGPDNHYLAQADAIDDLHNPFPTIYAELMEHPSNRDPVVVYVAANLSTAIEELASFVPVGDPDIRYGASSDQVVTDPATVRGFGDEVLGKVNRCWIVEWRALPSGYMLAHARGAGSVVAMREYPAPSLQGLFAEYHSPDGNLQEVRMIRYAGFGVQNRVAALAYYVGGAAYIVPAAFDAPLSV